MKIDHKSRVLSSTSLARKIVDLINILRKLDANLNYSILCWASYRVKKSKESVVKKNIPDTIRLIKR